MSERAKSKRPWVKKLLLAVVVLALLGASVVWYIFTEKHVDTTASKADYTVAALDLIREFETSDSLANRKYTEKILIVNGMVSEVEAADSTMNIKMVNDSTGSYIIFAFQQQHLDEAKQLKKGDAVSIKGSCSGGAYSSILETEYITFKRCALNK